MKDLIILVKLIINKTFKINGQIYNYSDIITLICKDGEKFNFFFTVKNPQYFRKYFKNLKNSDVKTSELFQLFHSFPPSGREGGKGEGRNEGRDRGRAGGGDVTL